MARLRPIRVQIDYRAPPQYVNIDHVMSFGVIVNISSGTLLNLKISSESIYEIILGKRITFYKSLDNWNKSREGIIFKRQRRNQSN